jgi:hypothetical protein
MNTMTLDTYIKVLVQKAKYNVMEYIDRLCYQEMERNEMIYIQEMSKVSKESVKEIDEKLIEDYLKKRGYTMNYILGKKVMVKDFTCVFVDKNVVEVWHDKSQNNKSVFVNESLLTGLPITLNYMERI